MRAMRHRTRTLERIEAGLRATASFARDVTRVPGFQVAIAPGAAAGLAVAVPDGGEPADLGASLAAVEAVFGRHGIEPTIEYVEELHPTLAAAARAHGWRTAMTAPLMVVAEPGPTMRPGPGSDAVRFLTADDRAALDAYLRGQHRAYGGADDDGALAWLPVLRAGLAAGTIVVVAVESKDCVVAGASVQIGAGVGELAGVWTLPEARRRGHAGAACAAAVQRVLTTEVDLCWLSAAPDATGLYERLGFRHVGTQRNLAGPLPERLPEGPPSGCRALS